MPAYFGSGGQLFEVKCPASADRVSSRPVSFTRTLGGRVKAFVGVASRRSWSLNVEAGTPQDVSTVEALARMPGPFSFISPEAAVGNLLSPQASGFDVIPARAGDAGLVALPNGAVARAISRVEAGAIYVGGPSFGTGIESVPVSPGQQVSFGAWATGSFQGIGLWRDASGTNLTTSSSGTTSGGAGFTYRTGTFTAPAGAASVGLYFTTSALVALPSISWGAVAADELGTGCPQAVVHDAEFSPIAAHRRLNRSRVTYSVTEVG